MAVRPKRTTTVDNRGDLPAYSETVTAFLDGQEKMLYGYESEWARALLLFYRFVEDNPSFQLPEGAHSLNDLVGFARQLGASAMIKRSDFDADALLVMQQAGITDEEGRALLDAITDKGLQGVAEEFDVGPGGLDAAAHPVRPDNALRAIRACMPYHDPDGSMPRTMTTMSLPRSVAGIMGAVCLAEVGSRKPRFAFPACENGDAVLGLFDAAQDSQLPQAGAIQASFFGKIGSALCKMSLVAAGYDTAGLQPAYDEPGVDAVPTGFEHGAYDCAIATYEPFIKQYMEHAKAHREDDQPSFDEPHTFTEPFPYDTGSTLHREEAYLWYCTSLLAKKGVAALWLPAAYARGSAARLLATPLLQENLVHAVVEFRQLSEANVRIARPMTLWVLKRGRKADEPMLLGLLDGDGFDAFSGGCAEQIATKADMSLSENAAAQKAVELIIQRKEVDRCAVLVSPADMLESDALSLRFIDYASPVDLAKTLAKPQSWEEMVERYKASIDRSHNNDNEFLAVLDDFYRIIDKQA